MRPNREVHPAGLVCQRGAAETRPIPAVQGSISSLPQIESDQTGEGSIRTEFSFTDWIVLVQNLYTSSVGWWCAYSPGVHGQPRIFVPSTDMYLVLGKRDD